MANERYGIRLKRDATQVKGIAKATQSAFVGAAQAAIALASGSPAGGVGALSSFFKAWSEICVQNDPERLAYLLVAGALSRTLEDSLPELAVAKKPSADALRELAGTMLERLAQSDIVLDAEFIEKPVKFPFLSTFANDIALALEGAIPESHKAKIEPVLRRHFTGALYLTLFKTSDFAPLEAALANSVREPLRREIDRQLYAQSLVHSFETRLLAGQDDEDDPVLLRDVFLPLRGYHEFLVEAEEDVIVESESRVTGLRDRKRKTVRKLVDVERCAIDWIERRDRKHAIMIVSGGPGMGKSSSLRSLAARLVREGRVFPVFLPLQFLEGGGTLEDRIHQALRRRAVDRPITHELLDYLDEAAVGGPVVLMFDGLDELVQSGEAGDQTLVQLVGQIARFLDTRNRSSSGAQVLALVSGRIGASDRAVKELELRSDQVVHLLPFSVSEDETKYFPESEKEILAKSDQRIDWWWRWRTRRRDTPQSIPENFLHDDLSDLSREPLLLYFLAFAESWKTEIEEIGSRNGIYDQVLRKFHRRECEKLHSNMAKAFRDFNQGYEPVLQALALAAWYDGSTRKGMIEDVRRILADTVLLDEFNSTVGQKPAFGVSLAFHLRPVDGRNTYEFLHKTFAEYLVARRFADDVRDIVFDFQRFERLPRQRIDENGILRRWLSTWGARAIDHGVLRFVRHEIALRANSTSLDSAIHPRSAVDVITALMQRAIVDGMPAHEMRGEERAGRKVDTFSVMTEWARNAEEALLVALNSVLCSGHKFSQKVSISPHPLDAMAITRFFHRLEPHPYPALVWRHCLDRLDLSFVHFQGADLRWSNLNGSDLRQAELERADLSGAYLNGADFSNTTLSLATLVGVNLVGANLSRILARQVDLSGANLTGANLNEAYLIDTKLDRSDLSRVDLTGARLEGTSLSGANLYEAELDNAELSFSRGLSEVHGLRYAKNLDNAELPTGWVVTFNNIDSAWDIMTPGGAYIDTGEQEVH